MQTNVLYRVLNDYFSDNISLSFKTYRNTIFIITKEDLFYNIDIKNKNISSFILKNDRSIIQSMMVENLSHKSIIDLVHQFPYLIAINSLNQIFLWNEYKGDVIQYTSNEKIIDFCCYLEYPLILTKNGEVRKLTNSVESRGNFHSNFIENEFFDNRKISMISCGRRHILALTECGIVHGWFYNKKIHDIVKDSYQPIKIDLYEMKIKKVSCGKSHSLLLTCDGDIYVLLSGFRHIKRCYERKEQLNKKLLSEKKFVDIATHQDINIMMCLSYEGTFYVFFPSNKSEEIINQPFEGHLNTIYYIDNNPRDKLIETKHKSFEEIINTTFEMNYKPTNNLIRFEDSFVRNGFYKKMFHEIGGEIGSGSFGIVFKAKEKYGLGEFFAIKKIEFNIENKTDIINEYLNFSLINRIRSFGDDYLVKHLDAWFEESNVEVILKEAKLSLYIKMELCNNTLEDLMSEINLDSNMKIERKLSEIGYYTATQIFIEILEGVNHLHTLNPPIIHRDLKPANILLIKDERNGRFVRIGDFGLIAIHKLSNQRHSKDIGQPKYTAPEVISGGKYNTKADIFSLGVILQTMLDLEYDCYPNLKIFKL